MESDKPAFNLRLSNRSLLLLLVGCGVAIVYGSLVPLEYKTLSWEEAVQEFREIRDLEIGIGRRADWVANILLYIPLGFLGVVLTCRVSESLLWRLPAVVFVAGAATALAFAVEFAQLWFPARTVSQNDLRAEAIGSCIGAIMGLAVSMWGAAMSRQMGIATRSLPSLWGPLYLAAIAIYSLLPGDFVLSTEEFWEMIDQGRLNLIPFSDCERTTSEVFKRLAHVAMFAPLGYLVANRLSVRQGSIHRASLVALAVGLGGVFSLVIEVAQLSVFTRQTSVTAVFFGAAGAGLGGLAFVWLYCPEARPLWLSAVVRASRRPSFWRFLVGGYAVAIALIMLAPFGIVEEAAERAERWRYFQRVPFAALYVGTEFEALTNILQKGVIFFGFGALLQVALRPESVGDQRSSVGNVIACGMLAALLGSSVEVAQVYIDSHQPDCTDVLIYTFFALVGCHVCDLVRRAPVSEEGVAVDEGPNRHAAAL